jgi:hypothetical protein
VRGHKFRRLLLNLSGGFANDLNVAYDGILIALALPKGAHINLNAQYIPSPLNRLRDMF